MSRFKLEVRSANVTSIAIFLEAMPEALRNKALRPMVEAMASQGAKRMKVNLKKALNARKRSRSDRWTPTGALHASIGVKRPITVKSNGDVLGVFGVRRSQQFARKAKLKTVRKRIANLTRVGFRRVRKGSVTLATEAGQRRGNSELEVRPSRYAHLVERGHGGPIRARAYPFKEPTLREMEGIVRSQGPQIIRSKWEKVVAAETRRLTKRLGV